MYVFIHAICIHACMCVYFHVCVYMHACMCCSKHKFIIVCMFACMRFMYDIICMKLVRV